jgi:hypothetical protein
MSHILPHHLLVEVGRICALSAWIRRELIRQTNELDRTRPRAAPRVAATPAFSKQLREWLMCWRAVAEPSQYRAAIYPLSRDIAKAWVLRCDVVEGSWRQVDHLAYEAELLRDRFQTEVYRSIYTLSEIQGITRNLENALTKLDQIGAKLT